LQHVQRCHAAKPLHLFERKIADADGADFPLLEQHLHGCCGFFDRNEGVGPMNLIDVDVIGSQPAQRVLDLADDAASAGIAIYAAVLPFEPDLGRNHHAVAQAPFGDRFADDLL
jgi:hypothetical protein